MHSGPRIADFPISHMPMHPSTQVAHMPLNGLTLSGVRFFDSVAADLFTFVIDILVSPPCLVPGRERVQAYRIETRVAQLARLQGPRAREFAYRAHVEACAALAARFRRLVEGHRDLALDAAADEPDRATRHLLVADANAQAAQDAAPVLTFEPHLGDPELGGQALQRP